MKQDFTFSDKSIKLAKQFSKAFNNDFNNLQKGFYPDLLATIMKSSDLSSVANIYQSLYSQRGLNIIDNALSSIHRVFPANYIAAMNSADNIVAAIQSACPSAYKIDFGKVVQCNTYDALFDLLNDEFDDQQEQSSKNTVYITNGSETLKLAYSVFKEVITLLASIVTIIAFLQAQIDTSPVCNQSQMECVFFELLNSVHSNDLSVQTEIEELRFALSNSDPHSANLEVCDDNGLHTPSTATDSTPK